MRRGGGTTLIAPYAISVPDIAYRVLRLITVVFYVTSVPGITYHARRQLAYQVLMSVPTARTQVPNQSVGR
eukprot:2246362-Rhodomonas_salina.1